MIRRSPFFMHFSALSRTFLQFLALDRNFPPFRVFGIIFRHLPLFSVLYRNDFALPHFILSGSGKAEFAILAISGAFKIASKGSRTPLQCLRGFHGLRNGSPGVSNVSEGFSRVFARIFAYFAPFYAGFPPRSAKLVLCLPGSFTPKTSSFRFPEPLFCPLYLPGFSHPLRELIVTFSDISLSPKAFPCSPETFTGHCAAFSGFCAPCTRVFCLFLHPFCLFGAL